MRMSLTGATGWLGSALAAQLCKAGHQVIGSVRSPKKAGPLLAHGVTLAPGTLDDLAMRAEIAKAADAVMDTAFYHDFSWYAESAEQNRRAIEAMGEALVDTPRPMLVTSGLLVLPPDASEQDVVAEQSAGQSEVVARALAARGVHAATVQLPPSEHGLGDRGFLPIVFAAALRHGVLGYLGSGQNRWAGMYRNDAARVFPLALEQGAKEPVYHALGESGVAFRDIAEVIGRRLKLPVARVDAKHFGLCMRIHARVDYLMPRPYHAGRSARNHDPAHLRACSNFFGSRSLSSLI